MEPIADQLSRVSAKVNRLVKDHRTLQRENDRLRQELDRKSMALGEAMDRCAHLERQAGILQASAGTLDEDGKREIGRLIEQYVREIDRCIARLGE
jgi:regulator of replication initiation timing